MRRASRSPPASVRSVGLHVVIVVLSAGCTGSPASVDAGPAPAATAPTSTPAPRGPRRPPYPNMATAAYGQEVLEQRLRVLVPGDAKTADVLEALHEMAPGSEQRAQDLAVRAYRSAKTDAERGTAVALFAAALVLEPTAQGYKDRLTDAFGVAGYAATLDATDAVGQGARALVNASAGAVAQADRLVEVVANTPHGTSEARLFLALTRRVTSTSPLDRVVEDLRAATTARPNSLRARAALAEILLDLGFVEDVIDVVDAPAVKDASGTRAPWLVALHGRALVVAGDVAGGVALLRDAEGRLDEGRRGDALYWLGRSLTQTDAWAAEVPPIAASLATRDGFIKEARALEALVALKSGDPKNAVDIVRPLASGVPRLPVDGDIAWLTVDACAAAGDAACVEEVGRRAVTLDGDGGRLFRARATLFALAPADAGPEASGAQLEQAREQAQRLSPFEDSPSGKAAAQRVRAARKAVVRGGDALARAALAPIAKGCRVCHAVLAQAADGRDAADSALLALALPAEAAPPLADADLLAVIDALGGFIDERTKLALETLARDLRPQVKAAVAQALADHKDPDARARREKGERPGESTHDHKEHR